MKVRIQAKRRIERAFCLANLHLKWRRIIDKALTPTPEEVAEQRRLDNVRWDELWADITKKQAQRSLVEEAPEEPAQAPKRYTVAKRSTGEIVAVYDDLGDAEEAILKAHRQKKATLVLVLVD